MSVDFDAKLTELAAEILRDAVQVYDQGAGLNPVLAAWNAGTLGGLDATGSFSAITGSFPALTGSFPALTGSFPALTGSFRAVDPGVADEPLVTLKRVFKLPGKLPGVRLLPEPELAATARSAPLIAGLAALARWLGQDGRLVTDTDDLADDDAADACRQLRIRPERLSALWKYALISGWFELEDSADRRRSWAVIGQTAWRWADGDDSGALHGWAAVFAAVAARALDIMAEADRSRSRRLDFEGLGVALVVMLFAARQSGMTSLDVEDQVREGAIGDNPSFLRKRAWHAWVQEHGHPAHRLLAELKAVGAVTVPRDVTGPVELTPLALWALRKQFMLDRISVPVLRPPSPRMTAADLVTLSEAVSEAEFDAAFVQWMRGRDPEQAARELLIYAGSVGPQGRLTAVDIARRIGVPGYRAWKDAVKRLELRGYARVSLSMMASDLPRSTLPLVLEPDPDDMAWLAMDLLATACGTDEPDPDEIATRFAEAVPNGQHERILSLMAQGSHGDSARILEVLGAYHPNRRVAREARKAVRAMAKNRVPAVAGR
jgi:hypothetical protein